MVQYTKVAKRLAQHVCVFGDPKSGKSTLVSQLAEKGYKLIWISCDNGHGVIDKLSYAAQERVDLIAIPDIKESPVAVQTVRAIFSGTRRAICDTHGIVNCVQCRAEKKDFTTVCLNEIGPDTIVVLDSASQVVESAINAIIKKEAKTVEAQDSYKLDYGDWATLGAIMSGILSNVQQARYHCVVITHTVMTEMEDNSNKLVPMVGSMPFSRNAGKYFDHIVYCGVRFMKHAAGSKTTFMNNIVTGSRTDVAIEESGGHVVNFFGPPRLLSPGEVITTSYEEAADQAAKPIMAQVEKDIEDALGVDSISLQPSIVVEKKEDAGEIKNDAKDALARLRASMGKK